MSHVEPRRHGGLLERELSDLGFCASDILDASVNINPYGPAPEVAEAVRSAALDRYPDPTAWKARHAIAQAAGRSAECVVLGNGAVDLIWTLVRALLLQGQTALVIEPAFSEFAAAVRAAHRDIVSYRARLEDGFAVDLDAAAQQVRLSKAAMVYLCTPANPTGVTVDAPSVARFAAGLPSTLVVLDESFLPLSDRFDDEHYPMPGNVVRVRSMTKTHALAGVRLGYLLASEEVAGEVERARPPWTTSAFAQAAACAAVRAHGYVSTSRVRVLRDRDRLTTSATALSLAPRPSATLFLLFPVRDATQARNELLTRHRVLVRDATSFGLPGFIRVCARPPSDDSRLLAALADEIIR